MEKFPGAKCDSCPFQNQKIIPPLDARTDSSQEMEILFIGDKGGYAEAKQGSAFAGPIGQILHGAREAANIPLEVTGYDNLIPCEPTGNSYDFAVARELCRDRLFQQIEKFNPKVVATLGAEALQTIVSEKEKVIQRKGELLKSFNISAPVLVMLHPRHIMASAFNEYIGFCRTLLNLKNNYIDNRIGAIVPEVHKAYTVEDSLKLINSLTLLNSDNSLAPLWSDIETDSLTAYPGSMISIAFIDIDDNIISLDWLGMREREAPEDFILLQKRVAELTTNNPTIWQNGVAFDIIFLQEEFHNKVNIIDDTLLKHYSIDESPVGGSKEEGFAAIGGSHSLKEIATSTFFVPNWEDEIIPYTLKGRAKGAKNRDYTLVPRDLLLEYGGYDVYYTKLIDLDITNNHWEAPDKQIYDKILMPVSKRFIKSQMHGVRIDVDRLVEVHKLLKEQQEYTIEHASALTSNNFVQLGSTSKMQELLFGKNSGNWGIQRPLNTSGLDQGVTFTLIKTLVGKLSTREVENIGEIYVDMIKDENISGRAEIPENVMKKFPREIQMLRYLMDFRSLDKLLSTYVTGLVPFINRADSSIHPSISVASTVTGRGSARQPSIMNIVKNKLIRSFFIPHEGYVLMEKDQAQYELRTYACITGDENMIQIFKDNRDLHHENCITIFGDRYTKILSDFEAGNPEAVLNYELFRKRAKYTVFGRLYNRTAFAVANEHNVPLPEAKRWLDELDKQYPRAKKYSATQLQKITDSGEISTAFGRRRRFPIVTDYNLGRLENQGVNFEIQSTASDLNFLSIVDLEELEKEYLFHILFPVHDSIMFEIEEDKIDVVSPLIDRVMEETAQRHLGADWAKVPFKVDSKIGTSWANMRKV